MSAWLVVAAILLGAAILLFTCWDARHGSRYAAYDWVVIVLVGGTYMVAMLLGAAIGVHL